MFKDVIRKLINAYPSAYWSDFIPNALILLRHTTTRAHGLPPYTIVTGQFPSLPTSIQPLPDFPPTHELTLELGATEEQLYVELLADRVAQLWKMAKNRHYSGYSKLLLRFKT